MHEDATRYPLTWPNGWKRTPSYERQHARFQASSSQQVARGDGTSERVSTKRALTVADAIKRLSDVGGSHDQMARLNAARDAAKAVGK